MTWYPGTYTAKTKAEVEAERKPYVDRIEAERKNQERVQREYYEKAIKTAPRDMRGVPVLYPYFDDVRNAVRLDAGELVKAHKAATKKYDSIEEIKDFLRNLENDNVEERQEAEAQIEYYTTALKAIGKELEEAKDSGDILAVKKARRELEDIKDTIETYKNYLANIHRHLWTKASPEEVMAAYMRYHELRKPEITTAYRELKAHEEAIKELQKKLMSRYSHDNQVWRSFYYAAEKPEIFFTDPTRKPWDQLHRVAGWADYADVNNSDLYKDLKAFESGESWHASRGN